MNDFDWKLLINWKTLVWAAFIVLTALLMIKKFRGDKFQWRFAALMVVLIALLLKILFAYGKLAFSEDMGQLSRPAALREERGQILDRNGKILAHQVRLYDVDITPPKTDDKIVTMAAKLAPILEMNETEILTRIKNSGGNFVLKRQIPREAAKAIEDSRLAGVSARPVPVRRYPEKNLASQIIGFVGHDYNGLAGVESAFNDELSGKYSGGVGSSVVLTIDANIQFILEQIAAKAMSDTRAESVMLTAMDPRSGEIIGSALLPGFDPGNHTASIGSTYENLTALMSYEPGSVFKVFSISSLMDNGIISENTRFICNGYYEKVFPSGERVRIECADGHAHGIVGPREIITLSCNVGAAYAADRQDNQGFYNSILRYGFGKKTGGWVLMETAGYLKAPAQWSGRTRQSIAFGQEISVSAFQMMQAASIIANDGELVPPKIISRIVSADGKTVSLWENNDNANRQVIRPETARSMLSYMTDTATEMGTGWRAAVEDLHLAVKTGTAQYRDSTTNMYSKTDFIASCIALLPAESPSLVLYAVIVKPRGEILGGRIAAPMIREAAEQLIDYSGIPRGRNLIWPHSGQISFNPETLPVFDAFIPNFGGLSKKTLLPLLLRSDITVEIRGEGWVRRQSPPPGTQIRPDTVLVLELE